MRVYIAALRDKRGWASGSDEPRVNKGGTFILTFRNVPSEDAATVNGEYTASLNDGTVALPYLSGRVSVAGKTARQVEDLVTMLYRDQKIYTNPIVSAKVDSADAADRQRRYVQVSGFVNAKKNLPYRPGMTLYEALLDCGDITVYGSRRVQVTRGTVTRTYDYFSAKDRSIKLQAGDSIYVMERGPFERRPDAIGP